MVVLGDLQRVRRHHVAVGAVTAPTVEKLPTRTPKRSLPPRLVHACCLICNPDRTFCGIDHDTLQRVTGKVPSCVVCVDIGQSHDWAAHLWGPR